MIPMVAGGGHSFHRSNIRWHERKTEEKDDGDGQSADSSRCPSRDESPTRDNDNSKNRGGGRFPRSATTMNVVANEKKERRPSRNAVEVVELKCEYDTEAALQDLMGLRVSGSRSVGVFVQSVHAGSVADLNGKIEVGDQLLNVESISLIGLAPDQAVRVLRAAFSFSSSSVRVTVAHSWADRAQRSARPPSSCGLNHGGNLSASRSEGALSTRSNHDDEDANPNFVNESHTLSAAPKINAGKSGMVSRRPSPPPRSPMPPHPAAPLVEVHRSEKSSNNAAAAASISRPHTQGATKLRRARASLSIDQSTTTTTGSDEIGRASCELEDDGNSLVSNSNITPSSISPAGSTSRFDSVLDMYDSTFGEKSDTVSTLPPRPVTSKRKTTVVGERSRRKSSLQFLPAMVTNEHAQFEIESAQSIDRHTPITLPGSLIRAANLRHRRVSNHSEGMCSSAGSAKTTDSRGTAVTELSRRFSPKLGGTQLRAWGSDESLHLPTLEEEDRFNVGKPPRSLHADDIKHFISNAQRKSMRSKDKSTNEELPLVSFDQLNNQTPSPTENHRRAIQSGSSGQSKSSKGSISSQGSQKLSWQCPVCLDGASRIRLTKRRMMSTACGHVFCSSCVEDVVGKYHMCPTCRMSIRSMKDVHPIFM